ncbi:hypothetical protein [Halapricum desulfuricans]|uniref:Uncharacterized protein n=1 Tax=Halapricum desulfuricans TaxID=2841257 RepID=A0A897N5J4_9EURY|nr:hypothetical protein [Halapricum desulfuricans]QSG06339.1 hypothetical protein HSR121_2006 [Halapricum desulfuricans]
MTIDEATIEKIESVPGLRTALEVLGEANRIAHEDGRCVIEFYIDENEQMTISEITQHVEELENGAD